MKIKGQKHKDRDRSPEQEHDEGKGKGKGRSGGEGDAYEEPFECLKCSSKNISTLIHPFL